MKIQLWKEDQIPYFQPGADTPNCMETYLQQTDRPAPAMVIFPGGGYVERAYHEGEPIAQFYQSRGFQAFVVSYRVLPNHYPAALADAQRAIKLVRANAAQWNVDPERVFVVGFSAGGHLAACTEVLEDVAGVGDALDEISARPNGAVLGYAFLSAYQEDGEITYGCGKGMLGEENAAQLKKITLREWVTPQTPPCFLWHTAGDTCVPAVQSLQFAAALGKNSVPYELHIFPNGPHGLGLAEKYPDVAQWAGLSADWIERNFME